MGQSLSVLARVAVVPTLALSAVFGGNVGVTASAQGGPPCGGPASISPVCGGTTRGSDLLPIQAAQAIDRIGERLPEVAQRHGMPAEALESVLANDRTAWLDGFDQLFFVEAASSDEPLHGSASAETSAGSLLEVAETTGAFSLSSNASSPRKIFLDFDGHVTTDTAWNNSSRPTITSAPWDMDGTAGPWSPLEQQRIREIWASVSEDFAGFDVDVTTIDPGVEALRKTSSNDNQFGVRIVVSPTNWYSSGAGGVAYVGSFSWGSDTPAFVFTQQLSGSSYKSISEAVAHEVGHTVSLRHDGYFTDAYYAGHGSWAPIMGVGYYRATTQWSRGEYNGATNTEDDLVVMRNHIAPVSDDHADSASSATPLVSSQVLAGVVGTAADNDLFQFTSAGGTAVVTVATATPSSNLDVEIRLETLGGATVSTANPTGTGDVTLVSPVTPGTYVVRIDGVGTGDPTTGYSDYGSIGRYTITAAFPTSTTTTTAPSTTSTTTTAPPTTSTTTTASPPTTSSTTTTTTTAPPPTTSTTSTTTSTTSTTTTVPSTVRVARLASVRVRSGSAGDTAVADVVLVDDLGQPVAGGIVTGRWSGQVKGESSAMTSGDGTGSTPPMSTRRSGRVGFSVTAVVLPPGYEWDGQTMSDAGKL